MITYGDFFTGFGGMTIGAKEAGLDVLFGVEYEADIADVYRQNLGDHIRVADLLTIDVADFPRVDVFHASPPCPSFSRAKAGGVETENDIGLSQVVADYIRHHRPIVFTLENVYKYRDSQSWHVIARTLLELGYQYNYWHVNMADYGVPQTRERMIVIARSDGKTPQLPHSTHSQYGQMSLFGAVPKWIGWYEAIEDLIPDLPDSRFAPWQLELLPNDLPIQFMGQFRDTINGVATIRAYDEPATTVRASNYRPIHNMAFLVDGIANRNGETLTVVNEDKPSFTIKARAGKQASRAFANGRVVQMTPQCLSRFQSFPNWYKLPDKKQLACRGVGNAVPPLFAQNLYTYIKETL